MARDAHSRVCSRNKASSLAPSSGRCSTLPRCTDSLPTGFNTKQSCTEVSSPPSAGTNHPTTSTRFPPRPTRKPGGVLHPGSYPSPPFASHWPLPPSVGPGPSFVLLADDTGAVFAGCVDVGWEDRERPVGGDACRLACLLPRLAMSPCKLYHCLRSRQARGAALGTGFGTSPAAPGTARLWLGDDLKTGTTSFDPSVGLGVTRPVAVQHLEVWGCGAAAALTEQQQQRQRDQRAAQQKGTADRKADWHEGADRALLGMAGLTVDTQARVSVQAERAGLE